MAEGEQKASRALKEAAEVIAQSPSAIQLRYLQTLNSIRYSHNLSICSFSLAPRRTQRSFSPSPSIFSAPFFNEPRRRRCKQSPSPHSCTRFAHLTWPFSGHRRLTAAKSDLSPAFTHRHLSFFHRISSRNKFIYFAKLLVLFLHWLR